MCVVDGCRIFAKHPVGVSIRLKKFNKGLHGYFYHVFDAGALEGVRRW